MEDIRTSEVLEKEVLEDARKKAERLLKNAEKKAQELETEWKAKTESELHSLEREFEKKKALAAGALAASFPLETMRRRLKYKARVFEDFLSSFFEEMSEEDLESLLETRGKKAVDFLSQSRDSLEILYSGLSPECAKKLADSVLGKAEHTMKAGEGFRGLVFSAAQQGFRYRLTAEEAAAQLREYSRREIHDALWKTSGEAAND